MEHRRVRYFPIALFSSVMGFAAVTIAVMRIEGIYGLNGYASSFFITLTSLLFLLNIGMLFYRLIWYPEDVQKDFNHPVKMNFFGAISISLLLLGAIFLNIFHQLSFVLWMLGAIMQLSLTVIFLTKMMWNASLKIAQFTPVAFIPIVGNLVVPIAGSAHVGAQINWFFFGVGALFSIIYMTLMFQRLLFHGPLPKMIIPTLFIILAPPSVGFVAYIQMVGHVDVFAHVLYGIAFFIWLFLLVQLKRILTLPFFVSAWALLFPSGAFTVGTILIVDEAGAGYEWFAFVLMVGLLVLLIYLTWKTLQLVRRGTLCLPEK